MKMNFNVEEYASVVDILSKLDIYFFDDRDTFSYFSKSQYIPHAITTDVQYCPDRQNMDKLVDMIWDVARPKIAGFDIVVEMPLEFKICLINWFDDVFKDPEGHGCNRINKIFQETGYGYYSSIEVFGDEE